MCPLLVIPSIILIFMLLVFPFMYGLYFSLHRVDYLDVGDYVGLDNYVRLLGNSEVMRSVGRSFVLTFASLGTSMILGFFLALWVNKKTGLFAYVVQVVGLIPWVTSMVVGSLLWKWVFAGDLGLFNYLRGIAGLGGVDLLETPTSAMLSLIFVVSWRTIGYSMVMILAGLKSLPAEVFEACKVDGASKLQTLVHVTIPLLKTPLLVSAIVLTLSNLNNATVPMTLTGGGPARATNVVALELYRRAFIYCDFGTASALGTLFFLINLLLVTLYIKAVKWSV